MNFNYWLLKTTESESPDEVGTATYKKALPSSSV